MNSKVINDKLISLSKSKFRNSFKLKKKEIEYINKIGIDKIEEHAYDFIKTRLAPLNPKNDGKQTPMHGHPVFIAQHATATCCRSCLEKWHHIKKDKKLTAKDQEYIVTLIICWIQKNKNDII